jgi:hypothetical protein
MLQLQLLYGLPFKLSDRHTLVVLGIHLICCCRFPRGDIEYRSPVLL